MLALILERISDTGGPISGEGPETLDHGTGAGVTCGLVMEVLTPNTDNSSVYSDIRWWWELHWCDGSRNCCIPLGSFSDCMSRFGAVLRAKAFPHTPLVTLHAEDRAVTRTLELPPQWTLMGGASSLSATFSLSSLSATDSQSAAWMGSRSHTGATFSPAASVSPCAASHALDLKGSAGSQVSTFHSPQSYNTHFLQCRALTEGFAS